METLNAILAKAKKYGTSEIMGQATAMTQIIEDRPHDHEAWIRADIDHLFMLIETQRRCLWPETVGAR